MTVHTDHPGLTAEVVVNGEPLREFTDDYTEDLPNTVTRFVEVTGEEPFEIVTKFGAEFAATYGVRLEVRLDGEKIESRLIRLKDLKEADGHKTVGVDSKIGGRWHKSKLIFSSFAIERDSSRRLDASTDQRLDKAGTITVILHRIKNMRWARAPRKAAPGNNDIDHRISGFTAMPEKKVQQLGLSHHGDVAQPEKHKRGSKKYCLDWVDGKEDENAFAVFHFKYRNLATLKSLHVMPSTPPPATPLPSAAGSPAPSASTVRDGSVVPSEGDHSKLSAEEVIIMIGVYRGHTNGLTGLPLNELLALLEHYRTAAKPARMTKRERDENGNVLGEAKRAKPDLVKEVIDLTI